MADYIPAFGFWGRKFGKFSSSKCYMIKVLLILGMGRDAHVKVGRRKDENRYSRIRGASRREGAYSSGEASNA
jgi:hypothetical protein